MRPPVPGIEPVFAATKRMMIKTRMKLHATKAPTPGLTTGMNIDAIPSDPYKDSIKYRRERYSSSVKSNQIPLPMKPIVLVATVGDGSSDSDGRDGFVISGGSFGAIPRPPFSIGFPK